MVNVATAHGSEVLRGCACVCVCMKEMVGDGGGHNMVMVTSAGITHSASPVKTKATRSE